MTYSMMILSESDHRRAVGLRLRQLIKAIGIPYVRAAEEMGVTKNHLGNWMRGTHGYPDQYDLYKFCRIRGVNFDWVFLGDPSGLPEKVSRELLRLEQQPESLSAEADPDFAALADGQEATTATPKKRCGRKAVSAWRT